MSNSDHYPSDETTEEVLSSEVETSSSCSEEIASHQDNPESLDNLNEISLSGPPLRNPKGSSQSKVQFNLDHEIRNSSFDSNCNEYGKLVDDDLESGLLSLLTEDEDSLNDMKPRNMKARVSIGLIDVEFQEAISSHPRIHSTDHMAQRAQLAVVRKEESARKRNVRNFLRSSLADLQFNITRIEVQNIILKNVGVLVSEDILDQIFQKAHKGENVCIDAEDLADYINGIRHKSTGERAEIIAWRILKSFSLWCSILFFLGGCASVSTNLRSRDGGDLYGKDHYYGQIGAWLWLIGSFGFVINVYGYESMIFERTRFTNQKLAKWIRWDLPRFCRERMDHYNLECRPQVNASINAFVEQQSQKGFLDPDREIVSIKQLRRLVESTGVFLTHDELVQIFTDAGKELSGNLTIKDLMTLALSRQTAFSAKQATICILHQCSGNVGFWTSTCFVVGSVPFVIVDFINGPPRLITHLFGVGMILYLAGALGGVINVYNSIGAAVSGKDRVDSKLRSVAVKLGMLITYFEKKLVRASTVRGVSDYHVGWLSEQENQDLQRIGAYQLFDVVGLDRNRGLEEAVLYKTLIDLGVFISCDEFKNLWQRLDVDRDNRVQCSAFVEYIDKLHPDVAIPEMMVFRILASFPTNISFWLVVLQIFAGSIHLFAGYNSIGNAKMTSNLYLVGTIFWMTAGLYNILESGRAKGAAFDQMQESKFILKEAFIQAAQEHQDRKSRVRSSQVMFALTDLEEDSEQQGFFSLGDQCQSQSTRTVLSNLSSLSSEQYSQRKKEHVQNGLAPTTSEANWSQTSNNTNTSEVLEGGCN